MVRHKIIIPTRQEAEQKVELIAKLTIALQAEEAALNEKINAAKADHQPYIEAHKAAIKAYESEVAVWASHNPKEFKKARSITFLFGTVGFRKTPLRLVAGQAMDAVLHLLCRASWAVGFVRTVPQLDKSDLLAAHKRGEVTDEQLAEVGLSVQRDETFYIKPKLEEVSK